MKKKLCIIALLLAAVTLLMPLCLAADEILSLDDLSGKPVGVMTGTIFGEVAGDYVENPKIVYTNSNTDLALLLDSGKISAYLVDEPVGRLIMQEYKNQKILTTLRSDSYGFIFPKDSEKSKKICSQLNEFLAKIKKDGTLSEIDSIWFGTDESKQVIDFESLTGENGVLNFTCAAEIGAPFTYVKDNNYAGYDVDIAFRFCREYGYGLNIVNNSFAGMLASISSGKCDFGASCITITAERKESVMFSDPDYVGGPVVIVKSEEAPAAAEEITSLDDLSGKPIGIMTGTIMDAVAQEYIKSPDLVYSNSNTDLALLLDSGKIGAYVLEEPTARALLTEYKAQKILTRLRPDSYGFIFPKDSEKSEKLCSQLNEFLDKSKRDGTLDDIDSVWFGTDESKQVIDFESLTGENGVLNFACAAEVGPPFIYVKDNRYVGYDVDVAVRFCREYGYGINIVNNSFAGMLASVSTGKCDFGASCITITAERKESVMFSDPDYVGGPVVVIRSGSGADPEDEGGIFASILASFEKTFIREDRWQLFLYGILMTLSIVVAAVFLGTLLGFLIYILCRKGNKVTNAITGALSAVFEKTPVVVILMILYYIIFGSLDITGSAVSVIAFTVLFAATVFRLISVGVGAIDPGQEEAARALGYSSWHAFIRVIFPQALVHILPGYKSSVISLIKDSAIVGYIAVEDLTKVSDIVRSRTYEAFFPIIATAIIYFFLSWLLTYLIGKIDFSLRIKRRGESYILKGVNKK